MHPNYKPKLIYYFADEKYFIFFDALSKQWKQGFYTHPEKSGAIKQIKKNIESFVLYGIPDKSVKEIFKSKKLFPREKFIDYKCPLYKSNGTTRNYVSYRKNKQDFLKSLDRL